MRWALYNLLFAIAYVAMLPQFLLRMKRRGGYRNRFADRVGRYPEDILTRLRGMQGAVWIHAVSVGEVYVAGQVMRTLRERMPTVRFVFSTTSSTGWREAEKQVRAEDVLIYNPLDFPSCVSRALAWVRPAALILTESELWPNLIRMSHRHGVPIFLVNARVSDRSAPGYRRLRFWFGPILRMLTAIMAQSDEDKRRLVAAGANPEQIEVSGSFKFDVAQRDLVKEAQVAQFLACHDAGPECVILLGGSTWPGEEAILIQIYQKVRIQEPNLRLVLVPRHFEKADAVQAEIERAGLSCIRKSQCQDSDPTVSCLQKKPGQGVILADTTGELMGFYGQADLVFVGKSLCEHGAQNMIEPCLCGVATLVGPHTENFRPVMSDLLAAGALIQVSDEAQLMREIERLVVDSSARRALGELATTAVLRRKGVVAHCADTLVAALSRKS